MMSKELLSINSIKMIFRLLNAISVLQTIGIYMDVPKEDLLLLTFRSSWSLKAPDLPWNVAVGFRLGNSVRGREGEV